MRIIETENFTRVLSQIPLGENPECVQIGANNGVTEGAKPSGKDYLYDFLIENKKWRALLIEPVPAAFDSLRENYSNRPERTTFFNCAIADRNSRAKIQLNGGAGFATSTLAAHSNNEKKAGFGGYIDVPVMTYQLACELAGFRNVTFVKIDAEHLDRLIVKTILNEPFLGKIPSIIQWEENHPHTQDPNITQLEGLGYCVVKTGLTKHGVYADRIAFHHTVVRDFAVYFSPIDSKTSVKIETCARKSLHHSAQFEGRHPLGSKKEIYLKSPKIIQASDDINKCVYSILNEQKVDSQLIFTIINQHYFNFNTKHFIDQKLATSLLNKSHTISKGYIKSRIIGIKRNNDIVNEFLIYLRAMVYGDASLILWRILINPNSVESYLMLSEMYSPYRASPEEIKNKLKYIERSYYSVVKKDPIFYAAQRKIWDMSAGNCLENYDLIGKYPFPLFFERNVFAAFQSKLGKPSSQKIYFLSTPSSGTQSIIFILTRLSNLQIHQYNNHRIRQEENHLSSDLLASINAGVNIHSHLPLPESAVRNLLKAGYKIMVLRRRASEALTSGARHIQTRPSLYPLDCSPAPIDYFQEITDFISIFEEYIDLHIEYSELKNSTDEVIYNINEKFFQKTSEVLQRINQEYLELIKNNKLNFRSKR